MSGLKYRNKSKPIHKKQAEYKTLFREVPRAAFVSLSHYCVENQSLLHHQWEANQWHPSAADSVSWSALLRGTTQLTDERIGKSNFQYSWDQNSLSLRKIYSDKMKNKHPLCCACTASSKPKHLFQYCIERHWKPTQCAQRLEILYAWNNCLHLFFMRVWSFWTMQILLYAT